MSHLRAPIRTVERHLRHAALLSLPVVAVVALHRLGGGVWTHVDPADPLAWLTTASPEDALAALLRLTALGTAYWCLALAAVNVTARTLRWRSIERLARVLTPATLRRAFDRLLATAAVAGMAIQGLSLAPAVADPGDSAAVTAPRPPGLVPPPATTGQGPPPVAADDDEGADTVEDEVEDQVEHVEQEEENDQAEGTTDTASDPLERAHRVVAGENLWTIARDHLAAATGSVRSELAVGDVARYWVRVVEENRPALRSGDPDLIYPGELVRLPPVGG